MDNSERIDNNAENKKNTSVFSIIKKTISTVIFVFVVLLAVFLGGVRIIGYRPYAVLSGSMLPKYSVGSVVYVKETNPASIKTGDVISFVANRNKTVVTHRVVKVDRIERCVYTKGDANSDPDGAPVYYENILGRVVFSLPWIGYITIFLSTTFGKLIAISAFFLVCSVFVILDLIKIGKKKS